MTAHSGQLLAWLIEHSRALESLSVCFNQFGARGVAMMAAALQPSSSLRVLSLLSDWGSLADAEDCGTREDAGGLVAVAAALERGWKASELRVAWYRTIDDSGARALAAALEQLGSRCTLTTLALINCGLAAAGALALVRAATVTLQLRSLELGFNQAITAADRPALVAACGPQPHFELKQLIL